MSTPGDGAHLAARELAEQAGSLLLELRTGGSDPSALGDEGDARAHDLLVSGITARFPGDAILSEEAPDDGSRLSAERVWIIDPLDGTREYTELGRSDWAVHVALWQAGELVAGAVALPALGVVYATDAPPTVPPADAGQALRFAVSRTRPPSWASGVAAELGATLVPLGSAGAKAMAVVRGEVDAYLHDGGQNEWDVAAPAAVAGAAGLRVCRLAGVAPTFNKPDVSSPDILVCRAPLAERLLEAITRRRGQPDGE